MQAVAQAGAQLVRVRDPAIAEVVARDRIVQNAEGDDLTARDRQLDDLVAVLCLSAIPVVHFLSF